MTRFTINSRVKLTTEQPCVNPSFPFFLSYCNLKLHASVGALILGPSSTVFQTPQYCHLRLDNSWFWGYSVYFGGVSAISGLWPLCDSRAARIVKCLQGQGRQFSMWSASNVSVRTAVCICQNPCKSQMGVAVCNPGILEDLQGVPGTRLINQTSWSGKLLLQWEALPQYIRNRRIEGDTHAHTRTRARVSTTPKYTGNGCLGSSDGKCTLE